MTSFHFNTAASKNARRVWHDFIDEKFGLSSVSIGDEAIFAGDIRCSSLGFLTLAQIKATHELGERSRAQVAKAQNEHFVIVLLRAGKLKITQAGRECVLSPNMFTLFDCNGPYTFHHVEPTEVLDVIVPAGAMRARLSEPEAYIAQPRSADSGLGRVMADMFRSLAREAPLIPEKAADDCARRVADMMGVLFDSGRDDALPIGESAVRSAIYRRCAAFIENNLDDPRLDPAKIAAAAGISVRYLHKIFRGSGESVGDYVRRVRLARSYDDLADLRKKHVKIKEIAFRCGFKNPTHFSDAFKDFHGLSPSEVRRGACLEHDPEKWKPVFRKDHAQIERLMGMTIRRNVIPINTNSSEADMPAADDTEIQRLIGELTDAWKRGDAKAYGARFLSDATFTNVNGEFYVGREAFDRRHAEVFGGVFRYTALAMTINKLRFIRPDVAIADIDTEVSGSRLRPQGVAVGPDGVLRSRLLMALVNERGA